jgi:hypothetical protein
MLITYMAKFSQFCMAVALASTAASACVGVERSSTPGQPTSIGDLVGQWNSTGTAGPCSNIRWQITNQTASSAGGTFSATCSGILLNGTLIGSSSGTVVNWSSTGTATAAGIVSCPFSIVGTATPESSTTARLNYNGTTCLGTFSGSEVVQR